jgi:CSLREA domain-containing protein
MLKRALAAAAALALPAATIAVVFGSPASAAAPTFTVDTTVDGGDADTGNPTCESSVTAGKCSLRAALQQAQASYVAGETVTINVPAGTFPLHGEVQLFQADIKVQGAGAGSTIIDSVVDQEATHRHLDLSADGVLNVALAGMRFTHGGFGVGEAGSIRINGAHVNIDDVEFDDNDAIAAGGAITASGTGAKLVVKRSTFTGNATEDGYGGAIFVGPGAEGSIINSTFTDNHAGFGAAVFVGVLKGEELAAVAISQTTISGNGASGGPDDQVGGAVTAGAGGTVSLKGSIVDNTVQDKFDDIVPAAAGTATPAEIVAAGAGPAVIASFGPANVGDLTASCKVFSDGLISSGGFNVVADSSCSPVASDKANISAAVAALGSNGGPTRTMAITAASPAADAGGANCSLTGDQRGVARPQDANADGTVACDSGAFELAAPPQPTTTTTTRPGAQPAAAVRSDVNFTG